MNPPTLLNGVRLLPGLLVILLAPLSPAGEPRPGAESEGFLVQPYLQLPTPDGMTVMWETSQKLPGKVEYGLTRDLGQAVENPKATELHELRLTDLKAATTYYYRARSGDLASPVYSFKTAPPPGTKRWRLALYGDSRSNPAMHRKVAEQIAAAKVDLIVHTGDIVLNGKDHDSWRKEFFEPIEPIAHSVPWVSTIGNHEQDSQNYFSYMALPGNERYFGFDFASAHIVCLDSNAWIEKGRDSQQYQWLVEDLKRPRPAAWTFVAFHHPLFSAHATRPVNTLRWDWAPLFLEPAHRVDAVFTGHDHFYARNWRMGRAGMQPQTGVLFLTSAGGGAGLYPSKPWDYVALEKSVHHFTLLDFDDDRVTVTPIDITGKAFDRYVLTKSPTPPEEFCAYEVEELRRDLRLALRSSTPIRADENGVTRIDSRLSVPTHFAIPLSGELRWSSTPGWSFRETSVPFRLQAGQPLEIPLRAEVAPGPFAKDPEVTIAFEAGKFRNHTVTFAPFQLAGPDQVAFARPGGAIVVDGKPVEDAWRSATSYSLLGIPGSGGRADRVQFLADDQWVHVAARLHQPEGGGRDQVRLVLKSGKTTHTFALSSTGERTANAEGGAGVETTAWQASRSPSDSGWTMEMAVPRKLFSDWSQVQVNLIHRWGEGRNARELHLCPSYTMGNDPDRIADWRPTPISDRSARFLAR